MKGTVKRVITLFAVLLLMLITACAVAPEERGTIEIRVTDPPPADVTSANVTAKNIEVHRVTGEESEWITIIEGPVTFDLMKLAKAEEAEILGAEEIKVGSFTQIRMDVDSVEVVTVDGDNITAEVPSGKLKIVRPFNVEDGVKTVLTLDFDGSKSVIITGKGEALFKPVVKLVVEYEQEVEAEEAEIEPEEEE